MTANLKSKLLALARAWRSVRVSVRMPACAAPHYAHLWPDRGAPFDGFDGEGRLLGGCDTARPAEPVVCRLTMRQALDLLAAVADVESARYRGDEPARLAAWRRIEQALGLPAQHSAPTPASGTESADPFDTYTELLRTGTYE
jgi:hypothetical protein